MAAQVFYYTLIFLGLTSYTSGASYCLCKDGDQKSLQKTIDYACGNGADCTPIHEKGACFSPDTVKDHCSYAANSYFQRKSQEGATCVFSGTTFISPTPPSGLATTCTYPSSASMATSTSTTGSSGSTSTPTMTLPNTGINNPFSVGPSANSFDDSSSAIIIPPTLLLFIFSLAMAFLC